MQTFTGHKNEKNFVGLTTNGEYIACGSENNSVFCYHKDLSKQLINYSFGTMSAATVWCSIVSRNNMHTAAYSDDDSA